MTETWARNMWAMLKDGGVWGVPRSGLMYRKEDGRLVLYTRMPWFTGLSVTPEILAERQDEDHAGIVALFKDIGVEVIDARTEVPQIAEGPG